MFKPLVIITKGESSQDYTTALSAYEVSVTNALTQANGTAGAQLNSTVVSPPCVIFDGTNYILTGQVAIGIIQ